jgi:hypothetical protein
VRPRPTRPAEADDRSRSLALDRGQRDILQRLIIDLELGDWASHGFELDPPDPPAQHARRRRVQCAFAIMDDLGWDTEDHRDLFDVRVRDEAALTETLLQWRAWQIEAIEDVHRDRAGGAPVAQTAPQLLVAAERLGVVAGMLRRLSGGIGLARRSAEG